MKAVVEPESRIDLDADGRVKSDNFSYELNEYDLYAVEEAIRLAEPHDAQVTVVGLGPEAAVQGLRKGLAMGADDAVFIDSGGFLGDAAASAAVLAAALEALAPDLVLAGVESDDLGSSQVGVLVAEKLGYPCVTMAIGVQLADPVTVRVRRELEAGTYLNLDVALPAVLTIQTGINEPRYPSLKGIMSAKRKELARLDPAPLGGEPGLLVETVELSYPPPRERAEMLEGAPDAVVADLLKVLREKEKVI
jgi:electron transfer flavoprotein beta subunit